jgi:hypothetical protein
MPPAWTGSQPVLTQVALDAEQAAQNALRATSVSHPTGSVPL